MKLNKIISVSMGLMLVLFLNSCSKDDDSIIQEEAYQRTQIPENISDIFVTKGDANAKTVWIYEQGGPTTELDDVDLSNFPNYDKQFNVYVHQVLTYDKDLRNEELTTGQGEKETAVNIEILHKVIQHFKNQGKKVVVFGHSYGAFIVTNYLAEKGTALADKYVIMAGRLDAEQKFYEGLINKKFHYFPDFVTPTLHPTRQPENNKDRIELFLAGLIMKPRYTQELNSADLSKVIYAFANDDSALGRLTTSEKNFLKSKKAEVLEITKGGHSAMFEAPHNKTIYDFITK